MAFLLGVNHTSLHKFKQRQKTDDDLHLLFRAYSRKLAEAHPDVDPTRINFVDLMRWVLALPDFDDDPKHCGEKILEAIQQAWIDEVQ